MKFQISHRNDEGKYSLIVKVTQTIGSYVIIDYLVLLNLHVMCLLLTRPCVFHCRLLLCGAPAESQEPLGAIVQHTGLLNVSLPPSKYRVQTF